MGRGINVLTGTPDIVEDKAWCSLPAVFRRVDLQVKLGYMSAEDVHTFLHRFLMPFLPGCTDEEWKLLETKFTGTGSFWNEARNISVDMLKSF